jgi:hypothetical protein
MQSQCNCHSLPVKSKDAITVYHLYSSIQYSGIVSYYKLGNFCVCVCVYVCPAIRFHNSQPIFSKFGGKPSTGHDTFRGLYMLCVHATRARARAVRMY